MSTSVTLPALGESVTEGTVSRWLKQVGDTVEADEPLLEVSTDKVDTEIPSPTAGVLLEIRAAEDETVEVGAVLAVIGEQGESPDGDGDGDGDGAQSGENQPGGDQSADNQESDDQTGGDQAREEPTAPEPAPPATNDDPTPTPPGDGTDGAGGDQPAGAGGSAGGTEVKLPALGESVTEGTVSRWLKQVGDEVAADEALLEVSTDKVDTEIPSPTAGTLLEIRVQEDETVEVGAVLAVVGAKGAAPTEAPQTTEPDQPAAPEAPPEETATETGGESPAEQTAAGDEGGQAPIPAPEPRSEPEPEAGDHAEAERVEESAKAAASVTQESTQDAHPDHQGDPSKGVTASTSTPTSSSTSTSASASTAPSRASGAGDPDQSYVTPLVRKLAKEHDIDLAGVQGTGVGGRIRKQDVLAAAEAAKAAPEAEPTPEPSTAPAAAAPATSPPTATAPAAEVSSLRGTTEKMSRLRKTIAKRMVESLQVSAQLTTVVEVDLTVVSRLRARVKDSFYASEGVKLSYLPFLVKAAVEALKVHPKVNATIDTEAGEISYPATENVAIAVDTEKGLLVPVIRDAGDLSIAGLAKRIADLASRTRSNKLSPDDLVGGTFTVTNTGSRGALFDTPIINQPQVAILGTGALVKRPVVVSDQALGEVIAVRDMMYLALSYDHRLVDGADAARFLSTLKARLEEGDFDAELGV